LDTPSLHIREHGQEHPRTAVLLHSSGQTGTQWRAYMEPLSELGWHTMAADLIGYGKSPPWTGSEPFHHRHDIAAVAKLLGALTDREHVVIGHSYGGFVGLQALLDPAVTASAAILFEPVAWGVLGSGTTDDSAAYQVLLDSGFFDDAIGGTEAWMQLFVEFWGGPGAWRAIGERGRAGMMRSARKTYHEVRSLSFDETPLEAYASLSLPVHLIHGDRSPRESRTVARLLGQQRPDNSLTEVRGGHMTPVMDPARVLPIIASKLGAL